MADELPADSHFHFLIIRQCPPLSGHSPLNNPPPAGQLSSNGLLMNKLTQLHDALLVTRVSVTDVDWLQFAN